MPEQAVFRPPRLSILAAVVLAICATPVAFGAPWLWLVYLIPLAIIAGVLWIRTTADAEGLTVRRLRGRRRVPWAEISSLRLREPGVSAVLTGGDALPLPAVRVRALPQLAAVSGGHLSFEGVD